MIIKKILGVLLVVCMVFGIAACGIKASDTSDSSDSSSKPPSKNKSGGLFPNNSGSADSSSSDSSSSDSGSNDSSILNPLDSLSLIDLPDGYPIDAYPFVKGTVITYGVQNESDGRTVFSVMGTAPKSMDDMTTYYSTLLASAENKQDYNGDGYFTSAGTFKDYDYQVMLMTDPSNADYTTMTIAVTEILTPDSALNSMEAADLPENYPVSQFPIIDSAKVYDASESESDGVVSYNLTVYTTHTFKEVIAFYENALGAITDKNKSSSSSDFNFSGTVNGYYFSMYGNTSTLSGVEITSYSISLDPVTE